MMLLGRLRGPGGSMECLLGIDRTRVIVVAQDDLTKYSWPVDAASLTTSLRELELRGDVDYTFTPDLPDRFRWVITAALQEALARKTPWWRRTSPSIRGLERKLAQDDLAA